MLITIITCYKGTESDVDPCPGQQRDYPDTKCARLICARKAR